MVVARHIGRLANNMFQIAAAIGYARKYGYQWAVDPGKGVGEPYSCIHEVFPNLPKCPPHGQRYHEHTNKFCHQHGMHLDQCHFDYHPIPNLGPDVTLTGFYQSWKYFEGQDEEIKKVFELPHIAGYEDYVSIHVRRGDYVKHAGSFPPITEKYLYDSMGYLTVNKDCKKFIFFSDDIQWCKDFISKGVEFKEGYNESNILRHYKTEDFTFEFSEGRSEREDLALMASCGHHIIANSTFSWMGAYLGHNPNRIVVSPSCERGQWFGLQSGVKKDCVDLLPPPWHQIKFR